MLIQQYLNGWWWVRASLWFFRNILFDCRHSTLIISFSDQCRNSFRHIRVQFSSSEPSRSDIVEQLWKENVKTNVVVFFLKRPLTIPVFKSLGVSYGCVPFSHVLVNGGKPRGFFGVYNMWDILWKSLHSMSGVTATPAVIDFITLPCSCTSNMLWKRQFCAQQYQA